jgi:hypothetical protein
LVLRAGRVIRTIAGIFMRKNLISYFILWILLLVVNNLFSQGPVDTSGLVNLPEKNAIDVYYRSIGDNSHLYNGSEYVPASYRRDLNPFFMTSLLTKGSLFYDGFRYDDVAIAYDIVEDKVVTYRSDQRYRVQLAGDKIGYFSILGHLFIRIVPDSTNAQQMDLGFYDQLYDGKLQVLAMRKKMIKESIVQNVDTTQIVEQDSYFIQKEKKYYPVGSQHTLLEILKDRKKDLKKYMRENKIRFKANPENAIILAAKYYDQIKN